MKYRFAIISFVFLLSISQVSFSQSIPTSNGVSKRLITDPWKVSNLLKEEYSIEQDADSNVIRIQIDRTRREKSDQTVSSIVKSATVRRDKGMITLEAKLRVLSGSAKAAGGFYIQGMNEQGKVVVFNNMQDWNIIETDTFLTYQLPLPFDTFLDRIHWGVYATGNAQLEVAKLSITIDEGEFASSWEKNYSQRVRDDKSIVTALVNLAKLWGYLKYHHPRVGETKIDWDQVLIDHIPKMFDQHGDEAYNAVCLSMLDRLGPVGDIKQRYRPFPNRYVAYSDRGTPNPQFENEIAYKQMTLPNVSYRLLALFRYWNVINYFFPYKYALGYDWDTILTDFIPVFVKANTVPDYKRAILGLNASLNDSHALHIGGIDHRRELPLLVHDFSGQQDSTMTVLPLKIAIANQKFYIAHIDSLFSVHSSLIAGDELLEINGVPLAELKSRYTPYIAASNPDYQDFAIEHFNLLSWQGMGSDSLIRIKYQNSAAIKTTTISYHVQPYLKYIGSLLTTHLNRPENTTCYTLLKDRSMYLNPGLLEPHMVPEVVAKLADIDSLIIDFRKYPNFMGVSSLLPYLVFDREPSVRFQWIDVQYPGVLKEPVINTIERKGEGFGGKLILLINEESISASEFFAMLFEQASSQARLVGRATAGATGNKSTISLPGGYTLSFSGVRVNYKDGKEIFGSGIVPDIKIEKSIESILNQRDEILEFVLKQ